MTKIDFMTFGRGYPSCISGDILNLVTEHPFAKRKNLGNYVDNLDFLLCLAVASIF